MTHHLHDDRLFDCYLSERAGERPDPPSVEHLTDCADCAHRFAEFASLMDGLRAEADAETDAIFTPDRLRRQQADIAARLAHVGHAARVLRFPRRSDGTTEHRAQRVATRWLAAAAAAGMFVGIGTAFFLQGNSHGSFVTRRAALSRPAHVKPAATYGLSPNNPADDRFLSELDVALDRPYTPELEPLDALTPHVREVSNTR